MKKSIVICIAVVLVVLFITTAISGANVELVSSKSERILTYNKHNYYDLDTYADSPKTSVTPFSQAGSFFLEYNLPEKDWVPLEYAIDYTALPPLDKGKKYTIDEHYFISKYDSVENPVMIIEHVEGDYTSYYLREDFTYNDLPTVDTATVQEIFLAESDRKLHILNEQEQDGVIRAIHAHSVEKMTDVFSFDEVEWSIYLCIRYADSPFVQVVGQYSPDFSFRK